MPASEAQVRANRENPKKSTGPVTQAGKEASRANAYKHGLTANLVLPEREAEEVERRYQAFCNELQPTGEVGRALTRHAAKMSVRMERCSSYETATLTDRVRQAEADFQAPEGADAATVAKLRDEAGKRVLFDASPEATLARKYELAAERSFFRALKELRQVRKKSDALLEQKAEAHLASILPANLETMSDDEFQVFYNETLAKAKKGPLNRHDPDLFTDLGTTPPLSFSVGQR